MRLQLDYDTGDRPPGFPWMKLIITSVILGVVVWLVTLGLIPR